MNLWRWLLVVTGLLLILFWTGFALPALISGQDDFLVLAGALTTVYGGATLLFIAVKKWFPKS